VVYNAEWLLPLGEFAPELGDFFAAPLAASRWRGAAYALPWFSDVGVLYWRSDLLPAAPQRYAELVAAARSAAVHGVEYGLVLQAARYEGLVAVFLEILTAFGGEILDAQGAVVVDSEAAVRALEALCASLGPAGFVPRDALTWHEEEARVAFQNDRALFMRNWPYAYPLKQDAEQSAVAGRFSVAPMPATEAGSPAAALGGSLLALNRNSRHPRAAFAVIEYLTRPEQMLERARVLGQYPPRPSLYAGGQLDGVLPIPAADARALIERAVVRPVSPVYAELSGTLQIYLHRALSAQLGPRDALQQAAREIRALLARRTGAAQ